MALTSFFVVVVLSMLANRIAAVALQMTGLSQEVARFQARSALSGAGFTTSEAEQIVGHPVRRRIVMTCMRVGNVGIVSVLGSLTLSVISISDQTRPWLGWVYLGGGLMTVIFLARSRFLDRIMSHVIAWALTRWTDLDAKDYANLLHLADGFGVLETKVGPSIAGQTIQSAHLAAAGIMVLGVQRPGDSYEGAPPPDRVLELNETVWLYGRTRTIADFCRGQSNAAT